MSSPIREIKTEIIDDPCDPLDLDQFGLHHEIEIKPEPKSQPTRLKQDEKCFQCKYCDKEYEVLVDFLKHVKSHTAKQSKPKFIQIVHKCDLCGEVFSKFTYLKNHNLKKHPENTCPYCFKLLPGKMDLIIHISTTHPKMVTLGKRLCERTENDRQDSGYAGWYAKRRKNAPVCEHCNGCH